MTFSKLFYAFIALAFLCSFAVASSNTAHVKINFAEARADGGEWLHHAKASTGDRIDIHASIFLDKGYEPYYEVKAEATVYGNEDGVWKQVKTLPAEYDYVYPKGYGYDTYNYMDSGSTYSTIMGYFEPWCGYGYASTGSYFQSWTKHGFSTKFFEFRNAFTAGEFEEYKISIKTSIAGKNSYDSENAYVQVTNWKKAEETEPEYKETGKEQNQFNTNQSYIEQFQEPKADCSEIRFSTADFELEENSAQEKNFTVYNTSGKAFYIDGLEVRDYNDRFEAEAVHQPSYIEPYGTAKIKVKVYSGEIIGQERGTGYASLEGHFESGIECRKTNRPFYITIEDSFEFEETAHIVKTNSFTPLTLENSAGNTENETTTMNGTEQESKDYAYFASNDSSCSALSISGNNVSLYEDESVYASFFLWNHSSEVFYVDWVYAYDLSDDIITEEHSRERVIEPGSKGEIIVKVSSIGKAVDPTGFLKVRGHFASGKNCYENHLSKRFSVLVLPSEKNSTRNQASRENEQEADISGFNLSTASFKELENGKGILVFRVSNFSGKRANIALSAVNAKVQPRVISVPNKMEEIFYANIETNGTGEIKFSVDLEGTSAGEHTVQVVKKQADNSEEEIVEETPAEEGDATEQETGFNLGAALFSFVESFWIALVVIAILIIAVFIVIGREQPEEPWAEAEGKEEWIE